MDSIAVNTREYAVAFWISARALCEVEWTRVKWLEDLRGQREPDWRGVPYWANIILAQAPRNYILHEQWQNQVWALGGRPGLRQTS